ncbi:hypothetical protein FA95DRAFT_1595225 [Auriscalpium vulgare]|uniref:Uncharacterized protein n=1 Tax=Auriscalpium vulgare TaxID=40419 RepID=A0ACB8RW32_9AGAM|nr:hypothetical protein FA95DRAFT_1595225 [Auriscalpium vulgare]
MQNLPVRRSVPLSETGVQGLQDRRRARSLPADVLALVFSCLSLQQELSNGSDDLPPWACSLFKCAQVCKHWQAVALENPLLWNRIMLSQPRLTGELLARSKNVPIAVHANFAEREDLRPNKESLLMALSQRLRLRELIISGTIDTKLITFLEPMQTGPAPLLEVFHLDNRAQSCYAPGGFFQGITPVLRSLSLVGCCTDWTWFTNIRRLTSLELHHIAIAHRPSLTMLLDILSGTPELSILSLFSAGPELRDAVPNRVVALPYLRKVSYAGDAADAAALITHIDSPLDATLLLTMPLIDTGDLDIHVKALLTDQFARRTVEFHGATAWRILYIHDEVSGDEVTSLTFQGGPEGICVMSPETCPFMLSLNTMLPESNLGLPGFITWTVTLPPFASVETLFLEAVSLSRTTADLDFLFARTWGIKTLVLMGDTFLSLCQVHQEAAHNDGLPWNLFRTFQRAPHLERLVIRMCDVESAFIADTHTLSARSQERQKMDLAGESPRRFKVEILECDIGQIHVCELWLAAGRVGDWDSGWDKQTRGLSSPYKRAM